MRIAVFPSDATGCGYYRLRWAAAELARQGYDVEIRGDVRGVWERGEPDRLVGVKDLDCDVAVFQRVFHRRSSPFEPGVSVELLKAVQAEGVAVVVDLDDDLGAVEPGHSAYRLLSDVGEIVKEGCRIADLVTVSTPALAKRYGNGKARVIPNGVPRAYLGIQRAETRQLPVVGWTGSPRTHVGDLGELGMVIRDLCREGRATFRAIGDASTLQILDVADFGEHVKGAPLHTFEYAHLYAQLDIALVPLRPTRFNAGKSWLKAAEAAALGVPVVMSPTPENVRLHELGVGVLAERPKDWRDHLLRILFSAPLRRAMAEQGRNAMADLTIEERIAPMCWEAWTGARALRSSRVPATVG
jgi:glycosyltransferase involved in cell wall biosynthesis